MQQNERIKSIIEEIHEHENYSVYYDSEEIKQHFNVSIDDLILHCKFYEYDYVSSIRKYCYIITAGTNNMTIHIIDKDVKND